MTTEVDNCNNALLKIGIQKVIRSLSQDSVEAKACNVVYVNTRDTLLRMAPWNCALKTANLAYITSIPGTPENTSPATNLWQPGQPRPPWAYEYQYPVDCLRACWIIPSTQTGFAGGIPITTAVTGGAPSLWNNVPIRFVEGVDTFYPVTAAAVANGGTGHAVGDEITLASGASTATPIGAPAVLRVATVAGGVITGVTVVAQILDSSPAAGGSYFLPQTNPVAQGSSTGVGIGSTFTLTYDSKGLQKVILTQQEFATLVYCSQVVDPNVWDPMLIEGVQAALAAELSIVLKNDKNLANLLIAKANAAIAEARKADGNEGLTINDVTPDWIRGRGICFDNIMSGPYSGFDWGGLLPTWG